MDLDWTQESTAGVTLVRARLRNERATDRRVRLRNRLDGPVLPPRRHGTPEAGWNREAVTTVVPAGGTVALGYACPAPATEPPVAVEEVESVTGGQSGTSPATAVRELGDHRPPRTVLADEPPAGSADGERSDRDRDPDAVDDVSGPTTESPDRQPHDSSALADTSLPDGATALLDRYRTRICTAEALRAAGVVEATALLDANGGLAGVESLAAELDADARKLRALARTAATLADRAAATTPPTDALRGLS